MVTERMSDLRDKEVICLGSGQRLGYVCDAEIDSEKGCILALLVPGPYRFFGLFGRGEDIVIPWNCIQRMGEDIILVDLPGQCKRPRGRK